MRAEAALVRGIFQWRGGVSVLNEKGVRYGRKGEDAAKEGGEFHGLELKC